MMNRAAVHQHRVTLSQEPLIRQRDITEIASIIEDFGGHPKAAARALWDAGFRRDEVAEKRPDSQSGLTIAEGAALAGVSISTIRRRIEDGTITVYRFGPKIFRLDRDELLAAFRPRAAVPSDLT